MGSASAKDAMEIILIVFAIVGALFGLWMMLHAIYGFFRHPK
jgi:hypothetical protein